MKYRFFVWTSQDGRTPISDLEYVRGAMGGLDVIVGWGDGLPQVSGDTESVLKEAANRLSGCIITATEEQK